MVFDAASADVCRIMAERKVSILWDRKVFSRNGEDPTR